MEREKDYINKLDLNMKTQQNIENFFMQYETGKISRDEYLALTFLSHSVSYGRGYQDCFNRRKSKPKN